MARASSIPRQSENPSIGPAGESLVLVKNKDGEELFISPTTLKSHMEAGWKPI